MLFDRFIFVLYLLLGYVWFLLGTLYETPYRYLSIVSMMVSLLIIILISLCQLQMLFKKEKLNTNDKWSQIAWSLVHLLLCSIFCLDGLELVNAVVIFGLCGLIMTIAIVVVASCACFVIMNNGEDWHAHIHLVCIMFWVIVQYMDVRLPTTKFEFITTLPIALMTCVRFAERSASPGQLLLWIAALVFHVLRDQEVVTQETFYWALTSTILMMSFVNWKPILMISGLSFAVLPVSLYILCRLPCASVDDSIRSIVRVYNQLIQQELELITIPLEEDWDEEDWDQRL